MSPPDYPLAWPFRSRTAPWVEYLDLHVFEAPNVVRRHRHATRPCNRHNLAIGLRDRSAQPTPCGGNSSIGVRRAAVKPQDVVRKTRFQHPFEALRKAVPALAVVRSAGLADLGRRVDLVERSVCLGEGDLELSEALRRDAEGKWG